MLRKMLEKALAVAKASPVCKLQSPAEDQSPLKIKVFMNEECDQYIQLYRLEMAPLLNKYY